MPKLLIVDDEQNVLYSLVRGLRSPDLEIVTAETAQEGLRLVEAERPDAVLLDVKLPDRSGLDVFVDMHRIEKRLPVIIMTAHTTTETAIESMKRGAFDYLLKPFDLAELKRVVSKALEVSRLSRVPAVFDQEAAAADDTAVDRIVGTSPVMQSVYKEIGRVAPQDVNVLILGESGTGKELVARAIYQHSQRADSSFMAINCAAIPETLLESELFGHEQGAFTGADRRRIGKFEQADGGTIFLDEIGDMASATQAKVLRVLQDGKFQRVGGNETVSSDVRILAATNRDLEQAIAQREFRQDLFYRLNTFTIRLPPLRDRLEDLPLLVAHFVNLVCRDLDRDVPAVSPETMDALRSHDWPGNVRELQSAIRYGVVHATGDIITPDSLPEEVTGATYAVRSPAPSDEDWRGLRERIRGLLAEERPDLNHVVHQDVDRVLIEEVLAHVDGHQTRAAELLGISRTTLRNRMQQLGLSVGKSVQPE
ncbi:Nitrogen regulation protein NR(I) [Maioricimonas rarisocia]|uniref:DNA-binding transcriptional regulator NtrC n=1 Tax=Maioricimonas rarisocia TaxID=2528026 RepID=A0A517Z5S5_9PLAN|nr:sigma-54 dependent transcriptional regulator [Maioricimonas rarisocia]QDU37848.1 Nitrogen regulation protein NR(I) [Maioricimonas rarisocia]